MAAPPPGKRGSAAPVARGRRTGNAAALGLALLVCAVSLRPAAAGERDPSNTAALALLDGLQVPIGALCPLIE